MRASNNKYLVLGDDTTRQIIKDNMTVRYLKIIILDMVYSSKEGHIASSFSILDILWVLYKNFINKSSTFLLSKGHASLALYSILNEFGFLKTDDFESFCSYDSKIGGHPTLNQGIGVSASTGSLGHGLPIAVGMALANKIYRNDDMVYCLIGDGEFNEGSVLESCLLAKQHELNNLCCIVDYNHSNDRAVDTKHMSSIFNGFGWDVQIVSGHNHIDLFNSFVNVNNKETNKKPNVIIAETIKGYGCKSMENNPEWHHKIPTYEEYIMLLDELDGVNLTCENNL